MEEQLTKIQQHFNSVYTDYDACCNKVVPRNEELQKIIARTIHHEREAKLRMLDLGIGTGLTTLHVLNEFPNAHIDGIDFSSKMLERAYERMGKFNSKVNLIEGDFTKQEFKGKYDAIFSAVSIHNLLHEEKKNLFGKIYNHLEKGGCFVNADFIKFKSVHLTKKAMESYEKFLHANLSGKELEHWLRHVKEEDLPATLEEQFEWLKGTGFSRVECVWLYHNLAVIYALK